MFFIIPLVGLITFQGKSVGTAHIVVTGSKLSGKHATLECTACHVDVHKPEINITICSTCHADTWDLVQAGAHAGGSAPFGEYCITCHDPHHSEYLWNLTKQDWILLNATEAEINNLCYQCHSFSPEEFDLIMDSHNPLKMTKPPFSPTFVLFLTVIAVSAITLLCTVAIMKSPKIRPKPTLSR